MKDQVFQETSAQRGKKSIDIYHLLGGMGSFSSSFSPRRRRMKGGGEQRGEKMETRKRRLRKGGRRGGEKMGRQSWKKEREGKGAESCGVEGKDAMEVYLYSGTRAHSPLDEPSAEKPLYTQLPRVLHQGWEDKVQHSSKAGTRWRHQPNIAWLLEGRTQLWLHPPGVVYQARTLSITSTASLTHQPLFMSE